MLLPKRDCDVDYDDPGFVMPWWMIAGVFVWGVSAFAIGVLFVPFVALLWRPSAPGFDDPIRAARARPEGR